MTSPVLVSTTFAGVNTTSNSFAITLPSSIAAGDLILVSATFNSSTVNPTISGYTQVGATKRTANSSQAVFYKNSTGSDTTATLTLSANVIGIAADALRITGWANTVAPSSNTANGSSTAPASPVLGGLPNADYLFLSLAGIYQAVTVSAVPSGYTQIIGTTGSSVNINNQGSTTAGASVFGGSKTVSATNTIAAATWTSSVTHPWAAFTVAVQGTLHVNGTFATTETRDTAAITATEKIYANLAVTETRDSASFTVNAFSSGGVTAWTPNYLPVGYLYAWYDAQDSSTLTLSGANVTQMTDKGPNHITLIPNISGQYPQYSATGFNGYPSITFSTSALQNTSASLNYSNAVCAFATAIPSTTNGHLVSASLPFGSDLNTPSFIPILTLTVNNEIGYWQSGSSHYDTTTAGVPHVLEGISNYGTDYTIYVDGSSNSGTGTLTGTGNTQTLLTIGGADTGANFWGGPVSGVVITVGNMTTTTVTNQGTVTLQQVMEGYMAWHTGLQANLPNTHPFYSSAPTIGSSTATVVPSNIAMLGW